MEPRGGPRTWRGSPSNRRPRPGIRRTDMVITLLHEQVHEVPDSSPFFHRWNPPSLFRPADSSPPRPAGGDATTPAAGAEGKTRRRTAVRVVLRTVSIIRTILSSIPSDLLRNLSRCGMGGREIADEFGFHRSEAYNDDSGRAVGKGLGAGSPTESMRPARKSFRPVGLRMVSTMAAAGRPCVLPKAGADAREEVASCDRAPAVDGAERSRGRVGRPSSPSNRRFRIASPKRPRLSRMRRGLHSESSVCRSARDGGGPPRSVPLQEAFDTGRGEPTCRP